jgi:hypothetical protein
MAKEYLYRVSNNTPGATDRFVIANTPGQALAYVSKNLLGIELCDGIAGAEAVKAGFPIERAVPAEAPDQTPQQPLTIDAPADVAVARHETSDAPPSAL